MRTINYSRRWKWTHAREQGRGRWWLTRGYCDRGSAPHSINVGITRSDPSYMSLPAVKLRPQSYNHYMGGRVAGSGQRVLHCLPDVADKITEPCTMSHSPSEITGIKAPGGKEILA
ncbi:hypothetical protein J6590_066082 [Homalodisca vitripennis]|nr:hypothetical protein J6590_066082 [Homalodisca vitripennis]